MAHCPGTAEAARATTGITQSEHNSRSPTHLFRVVQRSSSPKVLKTLAAPDLAVFNSTSSSTTWGAAASGCPGCQCGAGGLSRTPYYLVTEVLCNFSYFRNFTQVALFTSRKIRVNAPTVLAFVESLRRPALHVLGVRRRLVVTINIHTRTASLRHDGWTWPGPGSTKSALHC